jgi:hypothetical protein
MGYTSVRKCILIEIRTKFNLIHEKEWTGETVSNICNRYGVSRKTYYKWKSRYEHFTSLHYLANQLSVIMVEWNPYLWVVQEKISGVFLMYSIGLTCGTLI